MVAQAFIGHTSGRGEDERRERFSTITLVLISNFPFVLTSTTPGSVSLPHGFTHDKSVPYLFSTPQARSQQQTEILIHSLKKLDPVNDISGVLYLVDPMWIFPPRIWEELQFQGSCACANKTPKQQYLWTWCQSVVPNDAPRDFGPEVAFGAKFQIPVARQGGREMSAPRPYVTDPFRPLNSINNWQQSLYIQQHSSYFLHVVVASKYIERLRMRSCRNYFIYGSEPS